MNNFIFIITLRIGIILLVKSRKLRDKNIAKNSYKFKMHVYFILKAKQLSKLISLKYLYFFKCWELLEEKSYLLLS